MAQGSLLFPVGYTPMDGGAAVASGKLYFYRTGTTTAQNTYSDSALSSANANPVVLNSEGYLDTKVYGDPGSGYKYRVRLTDSADTQIWQVDDVLAAPTQTNGSFTAAVRGGSTAGTYEITTQASYYYRIGDLVFATVDITFAGSITAGGTGNLQITGMPVDRDTDISPVGTVWLQGVDLAAGTTHAVCAFTGAASLEIIEITDNAAAAAVAIGSVAASDRIIACITYVAA